MFRTSIRAAAVAATLSVIAPAAAAPAQGGTALARYSDLNLATDAGKAMLDRRIARAARIACNATPTRILSLEAAGRRCMTHAIAKVQPAVQAAVRGKVDLASRDTGIVLRGAR